jgi:hypothetical protein
MPVGVVKSEADEAKWEAAKKAAAESGHGKKWGLVMHIFQNMKKKKKHMDEEYQEVVNSVADRLLETATGGIAIGAGSVIGDTVRPLPGKDIIVADFKTPAQINNKFIPMIAVKGVKPPSDEYDEKRLAGIDDRLEIQRNAALEFLKAFADGQSRVKREEHEMEIAANESKVATEKKLVGVGWQKLELQKEQAKLQAQKAAAAAKHRAKSSKK